MDDPREGHRHITFSNSPPLISPLGKLFYPKCRAWEIGMPCSLNVWGLDGSSRLRKDFSLSFDVTVPNSSSAALNALCVNQRDVGRNKGVER